MTQGSLRSSSIDIARGIAVVLMIQTHAYDGWVKDEARASAAYRFTRFLGVLPLPTFLVLAGIGLALRLRAASARGESASAVRTDMVRRGLGVVLAGYATSAMLGLVDGATNVETYLRADVLHAIGMSIAIAAPLVATTRDSRTKRIALGLAIAVGMSVVCIPATRLGRTVVGPARFVIGIFVETPGVTRMPVVPLSAWLGVGFVFPSIVPLSRGERSRLVSIGLVSVLVAASAFVAMNAVIDRSGGPFDRTHPAIVLNLLDLAARAVALVSFVVAATEGTTASSSIARALALLGRHSLLAYAAHLPFAYGRIPRALSHRLDMPAATALLASLIAFTLLVVAVEERRTSRAR